jgi:uncharacterized repeat protein (TIGR01451 family)
MKIGRILVGVGLAAGLSSIANAQVAGWEAYLDQVRIKQAIADQLTPEQLEERRIRLAQWMAERAAAAPPEPNIGNDTCPAATFETGTFPFNAAGTTAGLVDDYDLPPDTTAPTCTASSTCTGAGPAGSLPRGAIYTGTGTAPDFAYKIRTTANCSLTITMDPTGAEDMALIAYQTQCSSALSDCACVDDTGVGGAAESVSLDAIAGTDYFIVVDGYSTGATPPGPAGPYTVSVAVSAGACALDGGAMADLSITKTDGVASVPAGSTTTYTITASNAGPNDVNGATVADTFPAACVSPTWTCVGAGGGTCAANGAGNINDTVNLPNGGSVTYTAQCPINSGATGTLDNTATVTGIGGVIEVNPANNSATDSNTLTAALAANVTGTKTAAGSFLSGSTLTYTIVLNNGGTGPQGDNPGDEFTDVLPASLSLVSASATSGTAVATIGTNTVTWNGSIATAGSVTITITATISPFFTGAISNQGTISFDGDGNGSNESSAMTDDPAAGGGADPTVVTITAGAPPTAVPTLGEWGRLIAAALMVLIALGAFAVIRRRQAV